MAKSFRDKVVWITGGSAGIGREMALEFARQGAKVAVSGRRLDRLEEVAREIDALGGKGLAVACDVADEEQVKQAVEQVAQSLGGIDVAIANAGFSVSGPVSKLTFDDWRRQFDVNVFGAAITAKYAARELEKTRGRLAIIGSVAGSVPVQNSGAYASSKAAVRVLAGVLSLELAPRGVGVTLVQPGFVKSEIAMVDNHGNFRPDMTDKRPAKLMWETDRAARVIVKAIARGKREFTFTGHGKLVHFLGMHFPGLVHHILVRTGPAYRRN